MDNRAVPEQTAGDWNTNNVSTLQMTTRHRAARATARETGCILNIEMHWIPRAQNDKADRCASIAIRTRTTKTISTVSETASAWHRHNLGEGCVMSPMLQSILRDFSVQGHLDFVLLVLLEEFSDQFMLDCANAIYIFLAHSIEIEEGGKRIHSMRAWAKRNGAARGARTESAGQAAGKKRQVGELEERHSSRCLSIFVFRPREVLQAEASNVVIWSLMAALCR